MKSNVARVLAGAVPLALLVAACGQVTGLSDDYTYDLTEGGGGDGATDAASDRTVADATDASDGAVGSKCSSAASASTLASLDRLTSNGQASCKKCLADQCCATVDACIGASAQACKDRLSCSIDCTEKSGADRATCFTRCPSGGAAFTAVNLCATQACKAECAFSGG